MFVISIIIPIYNVEPYIADCLQSVMRQNYKGPMECILVDDCGDDNSMEVAEKLIAEYDGPIEFKVLHHEHNRGISAARNTGMDAAKGDFVFFLDSDDWISDDCIEKLARPLQTAKFDIVVGDYEIVGELPYRLELNLPEGPFNEKGITKTFCNQGVYVMVWNKLYSKNFLDWNKLHFEEGRVYEDEILAFELSCVDKSFYVVKSVTYYYRIRESSIVTTNDATKKLANYAGVLQVVKEKVEQYKNVDGILDFYMFWIVRVFGWASNIEMDEEMKVFFQEQTKGYLKPIPNVRCLKSKHNRMLYFVCKKDQTYFRFQYFSKTYPEKLEGCILRNILNLLPYKKIVS